MSVSRISRLTKEFAWVVVGQAASVVGALVLVRVLTEYLAPAQYGELALGLTVAGLINQVVLGGLTAGIGRFYSIAAEQNDLGGYLCASRQLMGRATVVVAAIGCVLIVGLTWLGYVQWLWLTAATLALSALSGYNASLSGIQNAARQRAIVAFHGGLDAWLKILFAVGAILWLGSSSLAVVSGYALSSLLVTASQFLLLRRAIPHSDRKMAAINWGQQIWQYSWPFSFFGFFTWLHQASDRWALQAFAATEDVGLYSVVFQLGYLPIGLATGMAMTFLGPILYQRSGSASDFSRNAVVHRMTWRITQACFSMTALIFLCALFLHEWIFRVMAAVEYQSYSHLLPWMVMAGGIFAAGQMLALKLMVDMRAPAMTMAKIVTAILGVSLNFYGALSSRVEGVVAAQVVFSGVYFFWMAWLAQHPKTISI